MSDVAAHRPHARTRRPAFESNKNKSIHIDCADGLLSNQWPACESMNPTIHIIKYQMGQPVRRKISYFPFFISNRFIDH